jgi:hypothetical protein
MTTIIDGSNGVTFPNGSNPQAAPSKVLQVVSATALTQLSTTSTSFVSSGFSATITPLFSTSKILALFNGNIYCAAASGGYITLYRGSTNLASGSNALIRTQSGSVADTPSSFVLLDSPSTTSATTYTIYFYTTNAGNTFFLDIAANTAYSLTLMEIAQ